MVTKGKDGDQRTKEKKRKGKKNPNYLELTRRNLGFLTKKNSSDFLKRKNASRFGKY